MSNKVFISEADEYLFGNGTHYEIYEKLGAHPSEENGKKGMFFAVWAPNAASVHVIGSFNGWNEDVHKMERLKSGIWQLFIPGVGVGELYKYMITTPSGEKLYKADPYANFSELRPGTASRTTDLSAFNWSDDKWTSDPCRRYLHARDAARNRQTLPRNAGRRRPQGLPDPCPYA